MASIKEGMRSYVAGSMADRAGAVPEAGQGAGRPSIQRQGEGRRRLEGASEIRLDRIVPDPDQPRREFDEAGLALLAGSVRDRGLLQPVRVRWDEAADRYRVIVGERRYRAAMLAGLESIPCVVVTEAATPEAILEDQLTENALRLDLRPVEKAEAYRRLMQARGLNQKELAARLHVSAAAVCQALALLDLAEPIRESIDAGRITPEAGYHLARVDDPAERETLAREAEAGRLRRDDLRDQVAAPRKASAKGRGGARGKPPRKLTERVFRTPGGPRVTVAWKRGLDPATIRAALADAMAQLDAAESEAA